MQQTAFGRPDLPISLLGFGTMRLPVIGDNMAAIDEEKALAMIDLAYQNGVNYFDTAYMYHDHASEAFTGKALARYPRESFYLATKMPPWNIQKREDLQRIFDGQLKKCGVEYFDYYLMHCVTRATLPTFEKFEVYTFLREQQKAGKIGKVGLSLHDNVEVLEQALDLWAVDFAQIQVNYLDWEPLNSKGLYETLRARDIPIIVMEPVRGGNLATLTPESLQILTDAAHGRSAASWAMRFVGELPGVVTVLSGMSTLAQVEDNLATYTDFSPLSEEEHAVIRKAVEVYRQSAAIPCTACKYCLPCPAGVNIPLSVSLYNFFQRDNNAERFLIEYAHLGKGARPSDCTLCGACLPLCPQHLDIPGWMGKIKALQSELVAKQ